MQFVSGDDALRLWKAAGLWDVFQKLSQHIMFTFPVDEGDRTVFYGQKGYADSEKNYIIVINCDDDQELEHVGLELLNRVPRTLVKDGQQRVLCLKDSP